MLISGWMKTSMVDYPGKLASVVFTQGCNMKCFYCHNKDLIHPGETSKVDEGKIFGWLLKRKSFVEAVVVTGGEPSLQKDLPDFLQKIKNMGLSTKLDTNGTRPAVLEMLIYKGLLDYIAMDIKAPLEKYQEICGESFADNCIKESISIIKNSLVSHEFRTTLAPGINREDIKGIIKELDVTSNYYLQKCRGFEENVITDDGIAPFSQIRYRGF